MRSWSIGLLLVAGCFTDIVADSDATGVDAGAEASSAADDEPGDASTGGPDDGDEPGGSGQPEGTAGGSDGDGAETDEGNGDSDGDSDADSVGDSDTGLGEGRCSEDDASGCAAGCVGASFQGHDYAFCTEWVGWISAQQICVAMGGELARIESEDENMFVNATAVGVYNGIETAWIGARDLGTEGMWRWHDEDEPFWTVAGGPQSGAFVVWAPGEPSNLFDAEHCAAVHSGGEPGWWDLPCNNATPHVCEMPAG